MTVLSVTVLSVPDMSCGHCKASIETALHAITTRLSVDLPARQVTAEGATTDSLLKALATIGFPATVVS